MPRKPMSVSQKNAKKIYDKNRYVELKDEIKAKGKKYYHENKEQILAKNKSYQQRPEIKVSTGERQKRNRIKHPEKFKARCILNNAVVSGKISKPDKCSLCLKCFDRIEGHHQDYSKPLDVIWFCKACHTQEHINEKIC